MRKFPFITLLVACVASLGFGALHAEEISWSQEFHLSQPPNKLDPRWKLLGNAGPIGVYCQDGRMMLDTQKSEVGNVLYWVYNGGEGDHGWDGSQPSTLEVQVRPAENFPGVRTYLTLRDGANSYGVSFKGEAEMQTYRLILKDSILTVFRGENPEPIDIIGPKPNQLDAQGKITANALYFGMSGSEKGISEWALIRWTNAGAFPPTSKAD